MTVLPTVRRQLHEAAARHVQATTASRRRRLRAGLRLAPAYVAFGASVLVVAGVVALVLSVGGSAPEVIAKPGAGIPGLPRQLPNALAFWSGNRGLVATGTARPCAGAVSLTTDGGRSFRVLLRTRGPVEWVTTAGQDDAWALVETCKSLQVNGNSAVRYRLLSTVDGGRSWRTLPPSEAFNPSFASATRGYAVAVPLAPSGFIGLAGGKRLLATSDGGRIWRSLPGRGGCPQKMPIGVVDSPSLAGTWVLCVGGAGAGAEYKAISFSHDGGRAWRLLVNVGISAHEPIDGISSLGYPLGLSFSRAGFGLLWEDRGLLYVTRDGGRRWQPTGVLTPDVNYGISGAVLSGSDAFLLRSGRASVGNGPQEIELLRTVDQGQGWTVVHRWKMP